MWNGKKYLPYLLASIEKQDFKDFDVFILDNNSQDDSVDICSNAILTKNQSIQIITNHTNLGFAGGHNKLFEMTKGYEYVLLVNQDLVFELDCFEKLVNHLDKNKNTGAVSPRLMKWKNSETDVFEKSDIIDSLGTKKNKNWSFEELNSGETWPRKMAVGHHVVIKNETMLDCVLDVMCVSGTAPMYRREVVDKVKYSDQEVFDRLYESYKEDIDLGLRINAIGYKNITLLDAVAYHDRSAAQEGKSLLQQVVNKKKQAKHIKYNSYKNHIMLLLKFYDSKVDRLAIFAVLWYELGKFVYYLISSPRVLLGWLYILKNIHTIYKKRIFISKLKKQK